MNDGNSAAQLALAQLGASGQTPEQAWSTINRLLDQQAYTAAVTDLFALSSLMFLALIGLVWLTRPKRAAAPVDAGGAH